MRSGVFILAAVLAAVIYTGWRIWHILPLPLWAKGCAAALHILAFSSFFLLFALGRQVSLGTAVVMYELGTGWMIFFVYALMLFLLLDALVLFRLVPAGFLHNSAAGSLTVAGILAVLLVYGNVHYHHKYREVIDIETEKPIGKEELTVVLASDLHLGYHNRRAEVSRWMKLLGSENPDMVLFAGDILDGFIRPAREFGMEECFKDLGFPVYTALGNHEYITGLEESESFLADAGIKLLKDSSVVLHGVRIIGRDDRSNPERLPLAELAPKDSLFTIVLDHQPYHLEEAEACGIDFQFSGHTHHGQVWPGNWITDAMFEKAFGPYRRGSTRYYISSGLGIWGGKFRIGTRSEYVVLRIKEIRQGKETYRIR